MPLCRAHGPTCSPAGAGIAANPILYTAVNKPRRYLAQAAVGLHCAGWRCKTPQKKANSSEHEDHPGDHRGDRATPTTWRQGGNPREAVAERGRVKLEQPPRATALHSLMQQLCFVGGARAEQHEPEHATDTAEHPSKANLVSRPCHTADILNTGAKKKLPNFSEFVYGEFAMQPLRTASHDICAAHGPLQCKPAAAISS
eukprot:CAMPEP_0198524332 /NCGR_PEP_ID=MMETSP1462-20131121/22684_1 /TAXON_ID=1333877 /ORGANISM="Brandtodinium nutriculum, Strain RCC3387" /LENGTH=199 /DNA_ID=CAMNT_0044254057 /DNA_START=73 /DNA_END=670 /DNA_ORIENTATION=+